MTHLPATTHLPTMTPRRLEGNSDWLVAVAWPGCSEEIVRGFASVAAAEAWIRGGVPAWLRRHEKCVALRARLDANQDATQHSHEVWASWGNSRAETAAS